MNDLIMYLEIIGAAAFAISGAMVAISKDFDMFGIIFTGITTATGGGVIRDIILNRGTPVMFSDPVYCIVAAACSAMLFFPFVRKLLKNKYAHDAVFIVADSLGLAIFTAATVLYCINIGETNKFLIVFVSVITGVGGGVLRDLFARDTPIIFRKYVYASASIVGALVSVFLADVINKELAVAIGFLVIVAIRIVSAKFKINLPKIVEPPEEAEEDSDEVSSEDK
jgi:membrane protein